jgi:hypothetical protein
MKYYLSIILALTSGFAWAQGETFNPLKELQTVPNGSRITVSYEKVPLFNINRKLTIFIDGKSVADGDSENPATWEGEPDREFVFEVCPVGMFGLIKELCAFGGVMRPRENTLYNFELKTNARGYLIFLGKQSF